MHEILVPRTDAGVVVQVVVAATVIGLALWRSWNRPDVRLLLIGVGLVTFAAMGLRAAH